MILITGASGFIGRYLADFLLKKEKDKIIGCARKKANLPIPFESVDLADKEAVNNLLKKYLPQEIYHLAGYTNNARSFSEPAKAIFSNLTITANILQAVKELRLKSRILIVSTVQVYRNASFINEDSPLQPASPYALSKQLSEEIAFYYHRNFSLDVVVVRASNQIGPEQSRDYVASKFAYQIAGIIEKRFPAELKVGNLKAMRDFLDVRDAVYGYWLVMKKGKSGEIYNLASGKTISIERLLEEFLKVANLKKEEINIAIDSSSFRSESERYFQISIQKIAQLGFQPQIPLKKTLSDLIDFWRGEIRSFVPQ